jgi:DNA-binding MarR family transcriptional regulator
MNTNDAGGPKPETDDMPEGAAAFQDFVTYRMSRVQAQLNAQAGAVLRAHGDLTPARWRILSLIANGAPTRLMEICRLSGMDKGQVSRNLSRLVESGLLKSERDSNDLRSQRIEITDAGRQVFAHIFPVMRARHEYLLSQLSEDDLTALRRSLKTLEKASHKRDF